MQQAAASTVVWTRALALLGWLMLVILSAVAPAMAVTAVEVGIEQDRIEITPLGNPISGISMCWTGASGLKRICGCRTRWWPSTSRS